MKKVALVTVASLVLFACSSAPAPSTGPGGQGTKSSTSPSESQDDDGSGSSATPGGGSSSSGSSGTPATPGGTVDEDACYDTCDAQNPAGVQVMDGIDDQWTSCVCGLCAAACGQSLCSANPTEPADGDACDTCMQNAQTCHDAWESSCNANADCKKLDTCQVACEPPDADDEDDDGDDADDKTAQAHGLSRERSLPARTVVRGMGSTRIVVRTR